MEVLLCFTSLLVKQGLSYKQFIRLSSSQKLSSSAMFMPRLNTRANPACCWVLSHPAHDPGPHFSPVCPPQPLSEFSVRPLAVSGLPQIMGLPPTDYGGPHGMWQGRTGQASATPPDRVARKDKKCVISIQVACDSLGFYFADGVFRVTLCKTFAELGKYLAKRLSLQQDFMFFLEHERQ